MPDPVVSRLQAWIDDHQEEMIEDLRAVLRIPSLESEPLPNAPFGQSNRDALDWMLGKASDAGMTTIDLEGYCGYADFGSGEKMVMSLGHLDVVPVGAG